MHQLQFVRFLIFGCKLLLMNIGKFKSILWIIGILMIVLLGVFVYQMSQTQSAQIMSIVFMLLLGLLLGGVIAFLASKNLKSVPPVVTESSHIIVESMRKVFKVVTAEGHFNEIYNYEETSKIFNFIPSKKRALVIVEAKILVGYDFEKFKWEIDEVNRKVKLLDFPAPEILSTETNYKYYNIEEHFFNLFSKEDLAKIQQNGKKQVIEAAKKSHLPKIAEEQMKTLLTELLESKQFSLENPSAISESNKRIGYENRDLV